MTRTLLDLGCLVGTPVSLFVLCHDSQALGRPLGETATLAPSGRLSWLGLAVRWGRTGTRFRSGVPRVRSRGRDAFARRTRDAQQTEGRAPCPSRSSSSTG